MVKKSKSKQDHLIFRNPISKIHLFSDSFFVINVAFPLLCFFWSESKSKRVSLKKKYKIIKKVKEHHKKKAKEAKKLGLNHKKKPEKDPGIPNDWPFKEQELKALEARRARAIEELEQKKAARKERVLAIACFI